MIKILTRRMLGTVSRPPVGALRPLPGAKLPPLAALATASRHERTMRRGDVSELWASCGFHIIFILFFNFLYYV